MFNPLERNMKKQQYAIANAHPTGYGEVNNRAVNDIISREWKLRQEKVKSVGFNFH